IRSKRRRTSGPRSAAPGRSVDRLTEMPAETIRPAGCFAALAADADAPRQSVLLLDKYSQENTRHPGPGDYIRQNGTTHPGPPSTRPGLPLPETAGGHSPP